MAEIGELPPWRRGRAHVGELRASIDAPGDSLGKVREKERQCDFRLVQDEMVDVRKGIEIAGEQRSSSHHDDPGTAAPPDDVDSGALLDDHPADESVVRPREVFVAEPSHIRIDEAQSPLLRQHRGHGEQAKRRVRGPLAHELQRVGEAPERIGKLGVEQQDVHL